MDTWGIPGPMFLLGYLFVAVGAVLLTVLVRRARDGRPDADPERTPTGPEAGMLNRDVNAIAAAMAQLRADGLIDSTGGHTDRRPGRLEPFTRAVYDALGHGGKSLPELRSELADPLARLRTSLTDAGLLTSPDQRRDRLFTAFPVLLVLLVGIARIFAGLANGKPVLLLVLAVTVLGVVLVVLCLPQRRTRLGNRTLQAATRRNQALRPGNRPALAAYGPGGAGLAAWLFGGAALWSLDPSLAAAAGVESTGGSGGSSCGGTISSGGGCGGGGGGGCSSGGGGGGCGG